MESKDLSLDTVPQCILQGVNHIFIKIGQQYQTIPDNDNCLNHGQTTVYLLHIRMGALWGIELVLWNNINNISWLHLQLCKLALAICGSFFVSSPMLIQWIPDVLQSIPCILWCWYQNSLDLLMWEENQTVQIVFDATVVTTHCDAARERELFNPHICKVDLTNKYWWPEQSSKCFCPFLTPSLLPTATPTIFWRALHKTFIGEFQFSSKVPSSYISVLFDIHFTSSWNNPLLWSL